MLFVAGVLCPDKMLCDHLAVHTRVPEAYGEVMSENSNGIKNDAKRKQGAENAERGRWGEAVAEAFLRKRGWIPVGRNVRPCTQDQRCELDLIVRSRDRMTIVFVEVKTHLRKSDRAGRLWRIDQRKRNILLRACTTWILKNKWHGNFRFDVIQVYGSPAGGSFPEIDHMENVHLFPSKWRFW